MDQQIPHAALTDVGMRRDHNEDSVLVDLPILVVADGVGGSAKGEVASGLAIETFATDAKNIVNAKSQEDAINAMESAVLAANAAVHESQLHDSTRLGMATTITAAAVRDGGEIIVGHVGDSRLYILSAAGARQVSEDHSVVAELVRSGRIDAAEAAAHPQRNVITRALGPEDDVSVDAFAVHVGPGDWLLVCSDGLTEHVTASELAIIVVAHSDDPKHAAQLLIDLANSRGGSDNITVALAQPVPSDVSGELRIEELHAATLESPLAAADQALDSRIGQETPTESPAVEVSGEIPVLEPINSVEPSRKRMRMASAGKRFWIILTTVVAVMLATIALMWSQCSFLAVRGDDVLTVRQGLPFLGASREVYSSDLPRDHWPKSINDAIQEKSIFLRIDPEDLIESKVAKYVQEEPLRPPITEDRALSR